MTPTFAEHRGNEVYIYVRGRLVMKRWLHVDGWVGGMTALFQVNPTTTVLRSDSREIARQTMTE